MTKEQTYVHQIIRAAIEQDASDVHIIEHKQPVFRIDGDLCRLGLDCSSVRDMNYFLEQYIPAGAKGKDGDFSFTFAGYRWRGNFYYSNEKLLTIALRKLPLIIPSIEDLGLPECFHRVTSMKDGIVLVTGPTGSGKSTTIAALLDLLLKTRSVHLITIENPVEYLFDDTKISVVNQREVGKDTETIADALKYALRQDPDVILVGEIRDVDTARLAVNAAETGHLVFATLHTVNVTETVNRLYGIFPPAERHLVQLQISSVINLIVAQRLVKKNGGGRKVLLEALFPNDDIRELIRDGKTHEMSRFFGNAEYINTQESLKEAISSQSPHD